MGYEELIEMLSKINEKRTDKQELKTTSCSEYAFNALAIDEPLDICNSSAYRWIYYTLRGIADVGGC